MPRTTTGDQRPVDAGSKPPPDREAPGVSIGTALQRISMAAEEEIRGKAAALTRQDAALPAGGYTPIGGRIHRPAERRSRFSPILASFVVTVLLPALTAGIYYGAIASRTYVAEFRATVRSVQPSMEAPGLPALLGMVGTNQSNNNDANAVVQYLTSRDALEAIDKKVNLQEQYASTDVDWLSRLREGNTIEGFVRYWKRRLEAYYETSTGTIIVRVSAFTPDKALAAAQIALALSEDLINRLSLRTRNDTVAFAEKTVQEAERRLSTATERLRTVQDQERVLDPQKTASSMLTLSAKLKEQLAALNANLAVQRSYLAANAPSVRNTAEQIESIKREIEKLEAATTSTGETKAKPMSSVLGSFDQVEAERAFAEKNYASALSSLQAARLEAARQQVYLATIVRPELPQEANFPKPWRDTATVMGVAFVLWLIGLLSAFAIKEHT